MNSYYGDKIPYTLQTCGESNHLQLPPTMATVLVSFRAPADTYQNAIERDMEFHEQHGQLTDLQILVEEPSVVIDLTGNLAGLYGDGSASHPYWLDEPPAPLSIPPVPPPSPSAAWLPTCAICQESLSQRRRALPCGHVYDQACIRRWFNERIGRGHQGRRVIKACPICKNDFQRTDIY